MTKPISDPVKEDILTLLAHTPMSITELTEQINRPYTTVQQAHRALRDDGKIIQFDRRARGGKWTLGHNIGPKSIIPSINLNNQRYKMTEFTGVANLPTAAMNAMLDVLKAWTVIASTAERMNAGIPSDIMLKRLNRQKVSLVNSRNVFENMAFMCTQMIENPKFWDVLVLDQYPDDKDWAKFEPHLKEMYEHFFSNSPEDGS